ncbi:DUF1569 domain-containing protein [Flavobacterium arcticum]|uniref:DUF1569 domain-containing protein n=1 Tax=Flavobacterium arcticum TaxID=1784713 RepID=A0A345HDJ7_9FLAO|nr:DUF1569 domain-containing protein [Flavobacterium arcticum]AXG74657.1 DUF1569 domain-containing protein [Flavobacterium arcticum]KAF2512217.1 DUF1569 domain-containing protein [Flavobacterium arcticum]
MESVFDTQGNQKIVARIEKLTPITLSQWGKMTVSQMMEHCQQPIKVANGTLNLKSNWMSFLFGKMMKKKLLESKPFAHGMPTVKEFRIAHEPDFESTKKELIDLIIAFTNEGHASIKNPKHPFFGEMTMEEWDILQWKHLDHHLKQFGV